MNTPVIRSGIIPEKRKNSPKTSKFAFLTNLTCSQFTEYGELTKKEYSSLANAISKFNKEALANGDFTKLHIRTTDIGVVVFRKSTLTDKRLV